MRQYVPRVTGRVVRGYYVSENAESLLGDDEVESGTLADFGLDPDSSAALLDDAFADRQTDAGTRELTAMQPLEDPKDLLVIARIDPNAVVSNGELNRVAGVGSGNMNLRRLRTAETNGVREQLTEELG